MVPKFSIKKKEQNNFFLHPHESLWSIECDSKTDYECKVNLGMGREGTSFLPNDDFTLLSTDNRLDNGFMGNYELEIV